MDWNAYTETHAATQGRIDGRGWYLSIVPWFFHRRDPIPLAGSDVVPPFIHSMNDAAGAALERLAGRWEKCDGEYCVKAQGLTKQLQKWIESSRSAEYSGFITDAQIKYGSLREDRESMFNQIAREAAGIQRDYKSRCGSYRRENERARKKRDPQPTHWVDPAVEMPESLQRRLHLAEAIGMTDDDLKAVGLALGGD